MSPGTRAPTPAPRVDDLEPPSRRFVWGAAFVLFTITGFLRFTYKFFDDIARRETGTLAARLIEESTGTYAAMLLFVAVVSFAWAHPLDRPGWRKHIPAHIAVMIAVSIAHTTLLLMSRSVIFALAGLGRYDYGYLPARYLMEFGNDAVGYAVWVVVIMTYRHYRTARQREIRTAQLERGLAQAELRNLRLQLQPHFLFNALNTISSTMYDDPRSADRMIGQLSELLRLSLRTSHAQEVTVRDELEVLGCYIGIMRARFGDALLVRVHAPPDVQNVLVPSLLLQPLVENAIRHGNASRMGRGTIDVRITRSGELLEIEVADDGPGAPADTDLFGTGVGLSATRERLRLLYGDGQRFMVRNRDRGFAVTIAFPLRGLAVGHTSANDPTPRPADRAVAHGGPRAVAGSR
jgi:two-component system LytT family sensor kinase